MYSCYLRYKLSLPKELQATFDAALIRKLMPANNVGISITFDELLAVLATTENVLRVIEDESSTLTQAGAL